MSVEVHDDGKEIRRGQRETAAGSEGYVGVMIV